MKKIVIVIGVIFSIVSCSTYKGTMSSDELSKWSNNNDTIYYMNKPIAYYDHSEFELNPSHGKHAKPIQELSITQLTFEVPTSNLISYIHTIHPRQKVEIVVPRH